MRTSLPRAALTATDSAATFIHAHTTPDSNVPLLEECAICLENYSIEVCVRIVGITGCTHRVGLACLEAMLRTHPQEEKKCPLCRAVWISAPPHAFPPRGQSLSMSRRMAGMFDGLDGMGANMAGQQVGIGMAIGVRPQRSSEAVGLAVTAAPLFARTQQRTHQHGMQELIEISDSEEDYETQVQNFEDFTRDIASIRDRAQNTQLSRSRRRQNRQQRSVSNIASASNDSDNALGKANTTATPGAGSGAMNRFLNRNLNPFRPTANDFAPHLSTSISATRRPTRDPPHARRERRSRDRHIQDSRLSSGGSSHTASPTPPASNFSNLTNPTNPGVQIDMDEEDFIELPQTQTQSARDDVRARQLDQREAALAELDTAMTQRERAIISRERAVVNREDRVDEILETLG
ncbi:hypothetical protein EJ02DRAFT_426384 [Clathrospora elynae]|uniref:RING-type domain-containing protein n=1 Tax=Clathrospora elynae TaxID=706981 RepID=A0A6A5SDA0_9PLEO|nr:hypothetical protein EJ02DRAFT_426384 [Clathrospora elynae]